ncbi:ubiquinol cytochrome C oxidoreductase, cytochrome C1 subunit [Methylophaga frappieri]|uniref:Ubiquinol cytochrome C oxidoreductase, cytochrome C1 subunit n=1 Tax=Methylophaga frappieri (strain ATCC BAA-2434 / DSM 25690 / JAM7) TaxID=754477 RepID=I1YKA7_METFJ|nr:cytochrome c1 [Methylophaga frappieri]AFJ03350.1 ubiquinol cytochrome C oxidoreductase, cytochrome C1 subunit [Methylophaga frappieri]
MKLLMTGALMALMTLFSISSMAASSGTPVDSFDVDLYDKASLQRGAQIFTNYCLSCHSASYMRYNRMAKDLGMSEDLVLNNLMFTTDKIGDPMTVAMRPEDAKKWFGVVPPDLSVIARARGTDWLYSYLRHFYLDDSRPMGTNNLFLVNAGMPHVLWEQQGFLAENEDHQLAIAQTGQLTERQYDQYVGDLVNFLAYIGEPSKLQRLALGKWVLLYLAFFFIIAVALKKAYWKDVH